MVAAPRLRTLLGVALASACGLGFQVILTRLLSAVLAYHFSFLAISLALLGIGAGSLFVYLREARFDAAPLQRSLARWTAAYGLLLVVIPFGLVRLNLDDTQGVTLRFTVNLAAACVLAAIPCFVLGVVIALAIRGYTRHVVTPETWTAEFRIVDDASDPESPVSTWKTFVVAAGARDVVTAV